MKLGACLFQNEQFICIDASGYLLLPALAQEYGAEAAWRDMRLLIEQFEVLQPVLRQILEQQPEVMRVSYTQIKWLAPIVRPPKNVMCLGLNYLEHAEETAGHVGRSAKRPEYPIVFTKAISSITGHEADVPFDEETCSQLDWEAELGVIIGRGGRKISREQALSHVFGYTVINDLSARDLQFNHKQFFLGKSLDGACPIGPWIVTVDAVPDPQNLDIYCRVNGVVKQSSNTRHMIFTLADIIVALSKGMTLEAGDIIATGTPSGVGFVRQPPEFLKPGDIVECEVESVGILCNRIGR